MPLYLADFVLGRNLPDSYCRALMEMRFDTQSEPVTPARAVQLIQARLRPLLAEGKRELLEFEGHRSWERIYVLYPKLVFESQRGVDEELIAAATVLNILVRHSTRPPREMTFPQFVEVSSFTRMCGYLHVPVAVPQMRVDDKDAPLYQFCKLCWLPAMSRGLCQFHSLRARPIAPPNRQPVCALVGFKTAKRFRPAFEEQALKLASAEELAFHDSEFALPVLVPASGLRHWLAQRRPQLAELIGSAHASPDTSALSDLFAALYGVRGLEVARSIGAAVHLLTPITLRAEAWLTAWRERPAWGGARPGAGR